MTVKQPHSESHTMTNPNALEERKLFEAWYARHEEFVYLGRTSMGLYTWDTVEAAWQAWQSRASIKPASSQWLPIETAPKDETPIDLWIPGERGGRFTNYARVEMWKGNVFYGPVIGGRCCIRDASHWMRLPSPPTKEKASA